MSQKYTLDNDRKDLRHLWLGYITIMQNPGTLSTECSTYQFWKSLHLPTEGLSYRQFAMKSVPYT